MRSQQRFRSDHHIIGTEEVNKIALSSNDDKRIQTFDKITTFPYGTSVFKICENEMLLKNKLLIRTVIIIIIIIIIIKNLEIHRKYLGMRRKQLEMNLC